MLVHLTSGSLAAATRTADKALLSFAAFSTVSHQFWNNKHKGKAKQYETKFLHTSDQQ